MTLHSDIANAIGARTLGTPWTTADLLKCPSLTSMYAKNTLRSVPLNQSVSLPGLGLGRGHGASASHPTYYRVGKRAGALLFQLATPLSAAGTPGFIPVPSAEGGGASPDEDRPEAIVEDDGPCFSRPGEKSLGQVISACAYGRTIGVPRNCGAILNDLVKDIHTSPVGRLGMPGAAVPWDDRLCNYLWRGLTFCETQAHLANLIWKGSVFARMTVAKVLWTPRDDVELVKWANKIFAWGGTRQRNPVTAGKVRDTLCNALAHRIVHPQAPMNSGYTKVGALGTAYLEEEPYALSGWTPQVIYDSRVAASLISRLDASPLS